jgi:hypothetical protein
MPTITKRHAAVKTRLLVLLLVGVFMTLPIARCFADSLLYEAHCKEPLPVFTLGKNSNPTKDQESALCACIWNGLDQADRVTSENARQGKESELSTSELRMFAARFGDVVRKYGGMKLGETMREWISEATRSIYIFLLPFSLVPLAIAVLVFPPLAAWRKTRGGAGRAVVVVSYMVGATTWFLGAAVTFGSFGWIGLIIGLFIFGIGVVPLGIIGAFFKLGNGELGVSLCVMLVITLAARFAGAACVAGDDRAGRFSRNCRDARGAPTTGLIAGRQLGD